jgi:Transglycosylase-like domain
MAPTRSAALGAALSITLGGAAAAKAQLLPRDTIAVARAHERLVHVDSRLLRRVARVRGEHVSHRRLERLQRESVSSLRRDRRVLRARLRAASSASTASPALQAIAACESGGNPQAVGGGGAFRGKYQFTYESWAAVGGHGDPAAAPEAEQDRRAALLMARSGAGNWPVCG